METLDSPSLSYIHFVKRLLDGDHLSGVCKPLTNSDFTGTGREGLYEYNFGIRVMESYIGITSSPTISPIVQFYSGNPT